MEILTALSHASLDHEHGYEYLLIMTNFYKGLHPLTEGFCAVCSPISQLVPTLISCYNKFNLSSSIHSASFLIWV